jgi:adenylate cyclase
VAAHAAQSDSVGTHRAADGAALDHPSNPGPSLVREQLERILGNSEFIGSDRTRRFLRYVVEETLAGRGDRIKAFSVAVAAFDRDESFDPQTDPIVRIEAGRLRRNLERYYLIAGAGDPVRIEIPKGAYVPSFSWLVLQRPGSASDGQGPATSAVRPGKKAAPLTLPRFRRTPGLLHVLVLLLALASVAALAVVLSNLRYPPEAPGNAKPVLPHPSVAVLPLGIVGGEPSVARLATGMTNEVISELSRYSSVFVLGPQSLQRFGTTPDVTVVGTKAGVDFVLTGGIQISGESLQASVQLSDTETGGIVWAETYDRSFSIGRVFDLEVEIARDIVRQIAQPQGAIALFDWKRTRGKAPETWKAYDCVIQANDLHRRILPPPQAPEVLACLKQAVEQEPGYADAWIMLALVEVDQVRFAPLTLQSAEDLDRAFAAATRAVDLAPDSGRAHMALMMTLFFRGQVEAALAAGQVAVQLNPHDPDILAEVGLRNIVSGDVEAGMDLVNRAVDQSLTMPAVYPLALSLAYLRQGLYQKASEAIVQLGPSSNFVHWSIIAAVQGKAGKLDKARIAADEILKLYPDFPRWAWSELERRSLAPELMMTMVEGWRAAGLHIPASPTSRITRD